MSKTQENLLAAFAGESQANRKYLAFAKQADKAFPRRRRRRNGSCPCPPSQRGAYRGHQGQP